ncbi:MAG: chromosome segregation protein SMC [Bacteriovoracia bacterium]
MRVKRLELQGFKSFKDKTVIHFDDGITGIVGPNGCGKSNIVDSFFWVMGEQSVKHMRADGQIDLIFNGSEKYAPMSLAEVTLVLSTGADPENMPEDSSQRDLPPHMRYSEISVTRRLFRDGSSEYMINGQTCRLKDIHELFMDTGAGPKAYSIIEQGQISKIVASKPEDRRSLVEEAAGIVKFKTRKKESLRKIEATQQNLLRINDIIAEIERQLAFLERQATKARQYKKYKEELQDKELFVGRKKLFSIKQSNQEAAAKLETSQFDETKLRNDLHGAELKIEELKIRSTEAQKAAEEAQVNFQNLQRSVNQEDTKVQLQRRKIEEVENSNLTLEEESEELQSSIQSYNEQKTTLLQEVSSHEDLFKNADQILKEKQTLLEEAKNKANELGQKLEAEKRELLNSVSVRNEFSNQVHALEAKVDALSFQVSSLTARVADRTLDVEVFSEKSQTSKAIYDESSKIVTDLTQKTTDLRQEVQNLDIELKQVKQDESSAREERAKTESKLKALQELVDNHEGFKTDVKNILENYTVNGVFADAIEAVEGYELAVESILSDYLETLFVDNIENSKTLLKELKDNQDGRATFWALDNIERRASSLAPEVSANNAKKFSEVVKITHPKSDFILKFFNSFLVTDELEQAIEIINNSNSPNLTVVTKQGDVVDGFGRISGGSTNALEGGILARKAEIQRLTESLQTLVSDCERLSVRAIELESQLVAKRSNLEVMSKELQENEVKAKTSEKEFISAKAQLDKFQEELRQASEEKERHEKDRAQSWEKLDDIRKQLTSMEESTKTREQAIELQSVEFNLATTRAAEMQAELTQFKIDFATAQEKFRSAKQNLERVEQELEYSLERKQEVETLMSNKLSEKDFLQQELETLENSLKDLVEKSKQVEAIFSEQKNKLELSNAELSGAFETQKHTLSALEKVSAELNQLKVDFEKRSLEYQMLLQVLFEKYGIEDSGIGPQNDEEKVRFDELTPDKESELQIEVDKIREKLRKLGEVNLMAVEEYDEQKKRHEFLVSQREDLLKSILDLERAIERINKTSEERFKIAFHEINERFQKIFPIVFGGGWGKLELTNPLDLNETGVEIIVEPPGKKMGSIQLMSGGEKALTAVALIFSIFLIKPSPFCLLDEVDAPLDDHNVGKFNSLLREMSKRSQFIIITHNKRTMELNDKLYGVTMEEPGVSKMVSIQIQ